MATVNGGGDIVMVEGTCKKDGKVDLTKGDWDYETFFPEGGPSFEEWKNKEPVIKSL